MLNIFLINTDNKNYSVIYALRVVKVKQLHLVTTRNIVVEVKPGHHLHLCNIINYVDVNRIESIGNFREFRTLGNPIYLRVYYC